MNTTIEARSARLIGHCRGILEDVYSNLSTMPYGIRGICLKMIRSVEKYLPDTSQNEILRLIGNFVFYTWWIPAILDPVHNGLVQDFLVKKETTPFLLKIVNVRFIQTLKHIYQDTRYNEKGH